MKVGDMIKNYTSIGIGDSLRPAGHTGLVLDVINRDVDFGQTIGVITMTDITVLLDDASVGMYDTGSFSLLDLDQRYVDVVA